MSGAESASSPATPGWGRALVAAYAFMALAACARSAVQIATRFGDAPLAFLLSAASGAIYVLAAISLSHEGPRARRIATACCRVELAGVLAIGAWSLIDPGLFPEATVWSSFGRGYGFFPLVLPVLGLLWLAATRPRELDPSLSDR
ncbi:MAG TPA: hypothetical protein VMT37_04725 [Solirubrobacterales bacterium]|nr:hypothetical protein [Solirubrobacterales bacterium]